MIRFQLVYLTVSILYWGTVFSQTIPAIDFEILITSTPTKATHNLSELLVKTQIHCPLHTTNHYLIDNYHLICRPVTKGGSHVELEMLRREEEKEVLVIKKEVNFSTTDTQRHLDHHTGYSIMLFVSKISASADGSKTETLASVRR